MAYVSVTEAANLTGVSRGTIYNKIEDGELSRSPDGIDTNDLIRVFGDISLNRDKRKERQKRLSDDVGTVSQAATNEIQQSLLARLDKADDEKKWLRGVIEDKEAQLKQRDERLQSLLPAPGQVSEAEKLNRELGARDAEVAQLREKLESYESRNFFQSLFNVLPAKKTKEEAAV